MKNKKKTIAWVLFLAMLLSFSSVLSIPAQAADGVKTVTVGGGGGLGDYNTIQEAYDAIVDSGLDGEIILRKNIQLSAPLDISHNITIKGNENVIYPVDSDTNEWVTIPGNTGQNMTMISISSGTVVMSNLTIDADGKCRPILVHGAGTTLTLDGCKISKGKITQAQLGAGISIIKGATLIASGPASSPTVFQNNRAEYTSTTAGGGIYASESNVFWDYVNFDSNEANSGGAIYAYQSTVTCTERTIFHNNSADQRGGAIHSHGLVILNGTTISGQGSADTAAQYGGAIYVSASTTSGQIGQVVLNDVTITNNRASNSGAGIFIADGAEVYLGGSTSIAGNELVNNGATPSEYLINNVYVATANSKLIAYSDLTAGIGTIGISTSNPYYPKIVTYSTATAGCAIPSLPQLPAGQPEFGFTVNPGYTLPAVKSDSEDVFTYDSSIWVLKDSVRDTEASGVNPACTAGNRWLAINPEYGEGGGAGDNVLHFDYNFPGKRLLSVSPTPGTTYQLPKVSNESTGDVTFTFQGWYTEPVGGAKLSDPLTVEAGTHVYYAHWDIKTSGGGGGGGVPGDGDMYLVFFDYNINGSGVTAAYVTAGKFYFDVEFEAPNPETGDMESFTETVEVDIPFGFPGDPVRKGYTFKGWGTSPTSTMTVNKGSWAPREKITTLYGVWVAENYTLTWNANGGSGGTATTQAYDTTVSPPTTAPKRTGYEFTGWYLDKNCTTPLTSGTLVTGAATFYAGWKAIGHEITWDTNYTGGAVTTTHQDYGETLQVLPAPVREGYTFAGWYTSKGGAGTRAEAYGTIRGDVTFYAYWVQRTMSYTVDIEWDDHSDNDAVRPESVKVELLQNGLSTGLTHTFSAADLSDASGNKWTYTFTNLAQTDAVSNAYVYSVAVVSSVSDAYTYAADFTSNSYAGYILMTHSLILTDINAYVVWADQSDNDGYRPSSVRLRLYANGEAIDDAETYVTLPGSGDTWTYTFAGRQKYYTTADGQKGQEVKYTLEVTPTTAGALDEYSITYDDYTVTLSHQIDTISRTVSVEWQDSNNQAGKRPASMTVQLYADNQPVKDKHVILSDANGWSYIWDSLPKYTANGRAIVYSAYVTSTLIDYTSATTEMTIEMTYVPSSTTISAYLTWTDEDDADGLRPDLVTAELLADGKPTGDKQVLSATTSWKVSWSNYPIYKDGSRIEYTFRIDPVPDGYAAEYFGVYDTSGLSAVLTHVRERQDLTAEIIWNDRNNVSGDRLSRVEVMLYADGAPLEDYTAWLDAAGGWQHTFSQFPVYQDRGTPIKYSLYITSSAGKYQPATSGLTITMNLDVEYTDIPIQIIWDDWDDADGLRPNFVAITLTADGDLTKYQRAATESSGWAVLFGGHVKYTYGPDGGGRAISYGAVVTAPVGYEATYIGETVVLSRTASIGNFTATVTWKDNDNQYGTRPQRVTLTLYADYLDGEDPVLTGKTLRCYAADGWEAVFEGIPIYKNGKNILYSVQASGDLFDYAAAYDGMDVYLTHKGYTPIEPTTDYTATVIWEDGKNANNSRSYGAVLTLYADGAPARTYTLTAGDVAGEYTWSHTFAGLPTKAAGKPIAYTVGITTGDNYVARVVDNTITLTNVTDLAIDLTWDDDANDDGYRPKELTLKLYADGVRTDRTITQEGSPTGDAWRYTFEDVPVWSSVQTAQEITYTWLIPSSQATALAGSGYAVDYHAYAYDTDGAGRRTYPLTVSRNLDVADYTATVTWIDDTDRDGLRPSELEVRLWADYGDGKGPVDTGLTTVLTGGNEAESWSHVLPHLPVRANQGTVIVYTLRASELDGYRLESDPAAPALTYTHEPAIKDITTGVTWDDATDAAGLQRVALTAELLIDGQPTRETGALHEGGGWTYTWPDRYVYHDHGVHYDYSVAVSGDLPGEYEVTVDGTDVTVRRVRFSITGTVFDDVDYPVPGAQVTLYGADKLALTTTSSGEDGTYNFSGLAMGSYTVRAAKDLAAYSAGTADVTVTDADLTGVDITLIYDPSGGGGEEYAYTARGTVLDSNGSPAAGAQVNIWLGEALEGTVTADADGCYTLAGLKNGTYQVSVLYTLEGTDYTATGTTFIIHNADTQVPNITVSVPTPPDPGPEPCVVSGKVIDQDGKPLEAILVLFYDPEGHLYASTETGRDGTYRVEAVADGGYKLVYHLGGTAMAYQEFTVAGQVELVLPDVTIDTTVKPSYGILSGVVLDKDGNPVEGTEVRVYDKDGNEVGYQVTGSNGAYEFLLPEGSYTVVITRPFQNITEGDIKVDDDSVESGTGNPDQTVTADSYTIRGYVHAEDGAPIEGATVYLYKENPNNPDGEYLRFMETRSDAAGYYEFAGLSAGKYIVRVAYGTGGGGGSVDTPVEVKPNPERPDSGDITITTDSYTLTGIVKDKHGDPVKGATVTLTDTATGKQVGQVVTEADGIYTFTDLAEGVYHITIAYPDSEDMGGGDVDVDGGDVDVDGGDVDVDGGGHGTITGYKISGTVTDNKNAPLKGAAVVLTGQDGEEYVAASGRDGAFSVTAPNSLYSIQAIYGTYSTTGTVTVHNADVSGLKLVITLPDGGDEPDPGPGPTPPNPDDGGNGGSGGGGGGGGGNGGGGGGGSTVQPDKTVTISGTVTDTDGNPVEGADVIATNTKTGDQYKTTTDKDGHYQITVPAGDYTITIKYGSTETGGGKVIANKDTNAGAIKLPAALGELVHAYIYGYPDGTFGGSNNITRMETAAIISRVAPGFDAGVPYPVSFLDVPAGSWYEDNLGYCVRAELIQGRGNGIFDPGANITRAEFAAIVARLMGLDNTPGESTFSDVGGNWAEGYISRLADLDVLQGRGNGQFDPGANITRSEAVAVVNRALSRTPDKETLDTLVVNGTIFLKDVIDRNAWDFYHILEAAFDHYHTAQQ